MLSPEALRDRQRQLRVLAVERALRSPLFGRSVRAAGVTAENALDDAAWRSIPPMTKDDLRRLSPEELQRDMVICPRQDIREFWRSGGVTGEPLFYPRTAEDLQAASVAFRRVFQSAGIGPGDVAHVSFPIGVHPAGQHMVRAAQAEGAAVVWAGSGAALSSEAQVDLIHKLGATAWVGLASYGLHLASIAAGQGRPFSDGKVRRIISSADPITPAKRRKIEQQWRAELFDSLGMSEINLMCAECSRHDGMHLWTDMCLVEVLEPRTLEAVTEGEEGLLCVTSLQTNHATPFIRWLSGDVVRLTQGCACGGPFAAFPLLHHAGRTVGFFKLRGVNVNHTELEDFLLATAGVADYRLTLALDGEREVFRLEIETDEADGAPVQKVLTAGIQRRWDIGASIRLLPRGTLAREFESAVKPLRIVDGR